MRCGARSSSLPESQRVVVHLNRFEEMTFAEIAQVPRHDRRGREAARVPRLRGAAPAARRARAEPGGVVMTAQRPCDEIVAEAVGLVALPADAPGAAPGCRRARARTCRQSARARSGTRATCSPCSTRRRCRPRRPPRSRARLPPSSPSPTRRPRRAPEWPSSRRSSPPGRYRSRSCGRRSCRRAWPSACQSCSAMLAATASIATVAWSRGAALAFPALSALAAFAAGRGAALGSPPSACTARRSRCSSAAVAAGGAAWLLARALTRSRARALTPARPGSLEIAAVGGGALAGHAALHLGCSAAHELPHVLAFHTGPVALAVGLALLLASSSRRAVRESSRP